MELSGLNFSQSVESQPAFRRSNFSTEDFSPRRPPTSEDITVHTDLGINAV
jgi:hypothetical protein